MSIVEPLDRLDRSEDSQRLAGDREAANAQGQLEQPPVRADPVGAVAGEKRAVQAD